MAALTQQANNAWYHYVTHGTATACGRLNRRTYVLNWEVDCVLCLCRMACDGVMLTPEQRHLVNTACRSCRRANRGR